MKKLLATLLVLTAAPCKCTRIEADSHLDRTDRPYFRGRPNGRLYQAYLGDKLLNDRDLSHLSGRSADGKYIGIRWGRLFRTGCSHYKQRR